MFNGPVETSNMGHPDHLVIFPATVEGVAVEIFLICLPTAMGLSAWEFVYHSHAQRDSLLPL